jgi:hypothetical protein
MLWLVVSKDVVDKRELGYEVELNGLWGIKLRAYHHSDASLFDDAFRGIHTGTIRDFSESLELDIDLG